MSNERGKNINMHWSKTIYQSIVCFGFWSINATVTNQCPLYFSAAQYRVSALVIDYYSCCMLQLELSLVHVPSVSLISASKSDHLHCTKTVGGSIYM